MNAKKSSLIKVTFNNKNSSDFATVLKQRVDAYFQAGNISKYANAHMVMKTVFYFGGWLGIATLVLSGHFSGPVLLLMMITLGAFAAGIGFNIGHDAIHGSYSADPRVNQIVSLAFEMMGANAYTWRIRHNVLHHTYTNVIGSDGDLESMPLLRFCLKPGRKWFHAYQHIYAPMLYCFTSLVWVFKKDYKHILEERQDQRLKKKPPVHVYVSLVGFKLLHYFLFLVLPFLVLNVSIGQVVTGFLAMHFTMGFLLAMVFQLGHCVEGPEFLNYPSSRQINDSWAEHQLKTSSNFGSHFLNTWFCGGLNFQIEHHLFTGICHVHYKALSKIVREMAREYGLPYNEFPSFLAGVRSHFKTLKFFGRNDPAVTWESAA